MYPIINVAGRRARDQRLHMFLRGRPYGTPPALPKRLYFVTAWDRKSFRPDGRKDFVCVIACRRWVEACAWMFAANRRRAMREIHPADVPIIEMTDRWRIGKDQAEAAITELRVNEHAHVDYSADEDDDGGAYAEYLVKEYDFMKAKRAKARRDARASKKRLGKWKVLQAARAAEAIGGVAGG